LLISSSAVRTASTVLRAGHKAAVRLVVVAAAALLAALVLAGEQAAGKRRPREQREIEGVRHGNEFPLNRPLDERVFDLKRSKARPAMCLGKRVCLRDPPGGRIGNTSVKDLALRDEVIEGSHHFIDGRELIPDMEPIEVDVIGAEALEAGLNSAHHALAVITAGIGTSILARKCSDVISVLCRDHDLVAMIPHKVADDALGGTVGVHVGGVNEVTALLAIQVVDLARFVFRCAPAPVFTEGHSAERKLADTQAAVAEQTIVHERAFLPRAVLRYSFDGQSLSAVAWICVTILCPGVAAYHARPLPA